MPDGGNVVAFPIRGGRGRHDAAMSAVVVVSCALRTLGEPAPLEELVELVRRVDPRLDEAAVLQVLDEDVLADLDGVLPFRLFRQVELLGGRAWAFSPEYRYIMHEAGLEPNLR